jgi:PleD family two-component response regulator
MVITLSRSCVKITQNRSNTLASFKPVRPPQIGWNSAGTNSARHLAEAIRSDIARMRIKRSTSIDGWTPAQISVSLGIACFRSGESASNFFARADGALYASKTAGRNRVSVAHT